MKREIDFLKVSLKMVTVEDLKSSLLPMDHKLNSQGEPEDKPPDGMAADKMRDRFPQGKSVDDNCRRIP